jgi:(R,R)-butanediol dehydrogenase/meso-butanediol dehydrogenase/diacetyl reductase
VGPLIPGHEFAGRVIDVAPDVAGLAPGDWVATGAGVWCGTCERCRSGRLNLCTRYWTLGLQRHGGLAERCAVPARTCVRAEPYGLAGDILGLAQPMAIAVHSLRRGRSAAGEIALVVGVGGIGAFLVHALAAEGLRVLVSEPDAERRSIATALGADTTVDPAQEPVAAVVTRIGADVAVTFEVTGTAAGLQSALEATPPGGRLVAVGLHDVPRELDIRTITLREQELIGTNAHVCSTDLPDALRLLAQGDRDWRVVAPTALPLELLVEDALQPLVERRSSRIKTLIDPATSAPRETRMDGVA